MNTIIDLRAYADSRGIPTFVLVDMQQEYLAAPRGLALPNADEALERCRAALEHARRIGLPVAFVRWLGKSAFFNPATPFSRWIDGFEPLGIDMVFERNQPSCYASSQFADVMDQAGGNFVLAGFAGEAACLSTAIDAFHRGHRMTFLSDASASHALGDISAQETHRTISKVLSLYTDVIETESWIATPAFRSKRGMEHGNWLSRSS